ncbi:MAG: 4Fe-4S dicluster domain-containing protein [Planctomycetota bacterium]|jgi:Fe-S-cluster-containing dehydrogenase component/anaerobic selenocysteine-containing dehydrogenase|nr:4Fe-4S dicluster domain-containing protein [Planctomycetota bacterium]
MPSKQWKNIEELTSSTATASARNAEFGPDVESAMAALRTEYGLDEAAAEHRPVKIDTDNDAVHQEDLRQLLPSVSRRGFMKLTGAAAVFGLAGCWAKPQETLVPYAEQPEGSTIGEARYYSTAVRVDGEFLPVIAKQYDGRPIKLEGNPDDTLGGGTLSLRGQASLLDLYDPDRFQNGPLAAGTSIAWGELDATVGAALSAGGIGLVTGPIDGPANKRLLDAWKQAFGARLQHAAYSPFAKDEARAARASVFGKAQGVDVVYHFDRAASLVTFGSCPISGGHEGHYAHVAMGKQRRLKSAGAGAEMGQLIAFEPMVTQTGSVADLRQRVPMERMDFVAWAVAYRVAELLNKEALLNGILTRADYQEAAAVVCGPHPNLTRADALYPNLDKPELQNAIDFASVSLVANKGKSLVYVGGAIHNTDSSRGLYQAAAFINWILGNEGHTLETSQADSAVIASEVATKGVLAAAAAGKLKTLIIADANLAYSLPGAAAQIAAAKDKGCSVVVLAERMTETAALADIVAPTTHSLESWGDGEPRPGVLALQQPMSPRFWDNRQVQDSLISFAAAAGVERFKREASAVSKAKSRISNVALWDAAAAGVLGWSAFLKETWAGTVRTASGVAIGPDAFWKTALGRGFVAVPAKGPGAAGSFAAQAVKRPSETKASDARLILSASRTLGDGSQANNAWLQETPDPIGKVTWDNYLAVSLKDAQRLGFKKDDIAQVTVGETSFTVPVQVQPGQLEGSYELYLGWGQTESFGSVANDGGLGQRINAFALTDGARWGIPVQVAKADGSYKLASTQYHHYMDGRDIAMGDSIELHRKDADGKIRASHHHHLWSGGTGAIRTGDGETQNDTNNLNLWGQTFVYPGRRWGMLVDLSACDGCGACIVACGAENNVPVVGREEVRRGREMHWMRIDRYYTTPLIEGYHKDDQWSDSAVIEEHDPENLGVVHQPMMCQHCGHAPCEEVCPAMATMHNEETVNLMIYNRCIGTRFCANNCPYKVRRFNYYEYSKMRKGPDTSDPLGRVARNVVTEGYTTSQEELGGWEAPLALLLNPTVTVRSKGVMEKCNFCIQRTRDIREGEKKTNRAYDDTDLMKTTACAQTCPMGAITFGDIADPFSTITEKKHAFPHHYEVLDKVINTRPAVSYLRQIRNIPASAEDLASLEGGHGKSDARDDEGHHEGDGHDHGKVTHTPTTEGQA